MRSCMKMPCQRAEGHLKGASDSLRLRRSMLIAYRCVDSKLLRSNQRWSLASPMHRDQPILQLIPYPSRRTPSPPLAAASFPGGFHLSPPTLVPLRCRFLYHAPVPPPLLQEVRRSVLLLSPICLGSVSVFPGPRESPRPRLPRLRTPTTTPRQCRQRHPGQRHQKGRLSAAEGVEHRGWGRGCMGPAERPGAEKEQRANRPGRVWGSTLPETFADEAVDAAEQTIATALALVLEHDVSNRHLNGWSKSRG